MSRPLEPDEVILPPQHRGVSDETLEIVASLLDDVFHIPGTRIKFGLDGLIGLVPGLGDILTGLAPFLILFVAWQRKLPRVTQLRMLANIAIDTVAGSVPVFGDVFDVAWKSNRKNVELLKRAQTTSRSRQQMLDWLFLLVVLLALFVTVTLPIAVLWWIATKIR